MKVGLATPCRNCSHAYNVHDNGGDARVVRKCVICSCEDFEPDGCHWGHSEYCEHQDGSSSARLSQVGGEHYRKFKIQPWDIWQEYGLDAFTGAILKYLLRDKNNRLEDLKKARHTLDRLIEIEEQKGE